MEILKPKLRFPEFKENWKSKLINEILSIGSGRDYKHLDKGNIPVFGTGGLMTYVNDYLFDGETVCIGRKGTIDKPMYFKGKLWTVDTLFYTNKFVNSSPKFIFNLFQRINWKEYNEASGVPSLSKSTIEKIAVKIPLIEEQTKIANFLSAVDEKLNLLKEKKVLLEDYKKGIMQKIFNQEIRFKDDNGNDFEDWVEKSLGELCDYKNGGSFEKFVCEDGIYNLISLNSIDITGKIKNSHKKVSVTDNSLQKGDLIMVLSDVAHGNFLGLTDIVPDDNFVLNQRMGALKPVLDFNSFYLKTFINFNQSYFKLMGKGSSQQNLSKGDIESFIIKLPSKEEQTKIANFIFAIDEKIELVSNQIQDTQEYKKGLLQQMFV